MSQRLHIGHTDKKHFNCILTDDADSQERLWHEWLEYSDGICLGPWNITIADLTLFKQLEPAIAVVLERVGEEYPDCVWTFYFNGKKIDHPTKDELSAFLSAIVN